MPECCWLTAWAIYISGKSSVVRLFVYCWCWVVGGFLICIDISQLLLNDGFVAVCAFILYGSAFLHLLISCT